MYSKMHPLYVHILMSFHKCICLCAYMHADITKTKQNTDIG